jgi:uncharacterized protein (DUF927 family)
LALYFGPPHSQRNIGAACGIPNALTDIDLDSSIAATLWKELFGPPTNLCYGRDGKPDSHWLYYADPPFPSIKYQTSVTDTTTGKKKIHTILEVRCLSKKGIVGLQSMVPPSIHPSGERVRFEPGGDGDPAHVDANVLRLAAGKCAAAILLASNFPVPGGGRHDSFLALAGYLCRHSGWTLDNIVRFHCAIYRCLWPLGADFVTAQTEVQDTADQVAQGKTATGFPTLAGLIDAKILQTAFGWMGIRSWNTVDNTVTGGACAGANPAGGTSAGSGANAGSGGMPSGFRLVPDGNRPGIYFDSTDPDVPPTYVASPFQVLSVAATTEGTSWSRLLSWSDHAGHQQHEIVSMEILVSNPAEYRKNLAYRGLLLGTNHRSQELLNSLIQFWQPQSIVHLVDRIGWHDQAYVLPSSTTHQNGSPDALFHRRTAEHYYHTAGTYPEWRNRVSVPCAGNSRLVFAMSCAFAPPLLAPLEIEGGGIHFFNPSSVGKTTCQIVAGSAIGGGKRNRKGFCESWRTTSNAIELTAELHNDNLLVLDELAEISPQEAAATVYMLANGSGKSRMTRQITQRPGSQWLLLFLSSGERTLSDHVATIGKTGRVQGGALVRLLDVPADAGAGMGLFENIHGAPSPAKFADELQKNAITHYGHAQRRFLDCLVRDYYDLIYDARKIMEDEFLPAMPSSPSPEIGRGLKRIAVIAAGGELATRLDITGWERGEAIDAGKAIAHAWIDSRGGAQTAADIEGAIHKIRLFIEANPSRFQRADPATSLYGNPVGERILNRAGYWRLARTRQRDENPDNPQHINTEDPEAREYLFFRETFQQEVCPGNYNAVAAELLQRQYLVAGNDPLHRFMLQVRDPENPNKRIWVYCVDSAILGE